MPRNNLCHVLFRLSGMYADVSWPGLPLCVSVEWDAGGDALASDLIWRELRVLAEKKPVIASMGDVAASGAL